MKLKTQNAKRKTFRIGIAAAKFNPEYTDALVDTACSLLKDWHVEVVRVPGAFEVPLAAKKLLKRKDIDAVIAFGLIWQGKTDHARLLAESVTFALMDLMLEFEKPVIHQVLSVKTEAEAKARCTGESLNRGREAALALLSLLSIEN